MKKKLIFFYIILVSQSCVLQGPFDKREIKFVNKSNGIIYWIDSQTDLLDDHNSQSVISGREELFRTDKDSDILMFDRPRNWDNYIKDCKDGKLRVFVIAKDSVDKYGWGKIINKSIYTKVYKLDTADLNKLKWVITYNGE